MTSVMQDKNLWRIIGPLFGNSGTPVTVTPDHVYALLPLTNKFSEDECPLLVELIERLLRGEEVIVMD